MKLNKTYPYKTTCSYNQHEIPYEAANAFAVGWADGFLGEHQPEGCRDRAAYEAGYALGKPGQGFKEAWFQFVEYWNEQSEMRDKDKLPTIEDLPEGAL